MNVKARIRYRQALENAVLFKVIKPKGVILYFHGNKGNLIRWGNIVQQFTDYNYDSLYRLIYVAYPYGDTVAYAYDAANAVERVKKLVNA